MADTGAIIGVYRQRNAAHVLDLIEPALAAGWETAWWALDGQHPQLAEYTIGEGPGEKLPLLNRALARLQATQTWVVVSDDDLRFLSGDVVQFLAICEEAAFDLAQPARERGTPFSHEITLRSSDSRARATSFVESGPLFAVGPRCRDRVLPLPEHRGMGWGVEIDWFDLFEDGCRLGIVDAMPIEHVGLPIRDYDYSEMNRRMKDELAARGRPYWAGMQETVAVWRPRDLRPPWTGVQQTAGPDIADFVGGHPERFVPHLMSGLMIDAEHRARYWWATSFVRGRDVLDAACGTGYGTNILAQAGAASVYGLDRGAHVIELAQKNAARSARFEVGDLVALPFDDCSFDVAVCFETIEHVDAPESALDELARTLRPGGLLAISSPNRDVYDQSNPHHRHEYEAEELRAALERRFKNVRLLRQQDWYSTAILEDDEFMDDAGAPISDSTVRKISMAEPGRETFTVALASDSALPPSAPVVVLARDLDIRNLAEEADRARVAAAKAQGRLQALESARLVRYALALRSMYAGARRQLRSTARIIERRRVQ